MPRLNDAMITKDMVMPLLLEACPSFAERWKAHRAYYGDDEPLLYVDLGEFAHHLVDLYTTEKWSEFASVFEVAERLHLEGDPYVKEAATVGLLEGLQHVSENRGVDPEWVACYLKPESRKWWRQLNLFWEGKIRFVGASLDEA